MKITRDNYEIYFIDYLDGTLPPELVDELKAFLLVNRDLEEQLQAVEDCQLPEFTGHFPDKASLKKELCHECRDYYAIAAAENVLSSNDRKVLGRRIDSPIFQSLVQTYRTLKLQPDLNIRFEKKTRLYRKNFRQILRYRTVGIAAGLLLLVGVGISLLQTREHQSSGLPSYAFVLLQPQEVTLPAEPAIAPVKPTGQVAVSQFRPQSRIPEQAKPVKKPDLPTGELSPFPITTPVFAQVENDLPENPLELIAKHPGSEEIYLTVNAREWKQSGEGFFSNTIISSAYSTGKNLTEKIKEKITEIRSNKSIPEYVIE